MARRRYRKKEGPVQKRVRIYGGAGKQLVNDVMYLKSVINSELHQHIVSQTHQITDLGRVISLCDVPQGDSANRRTGNSILPRYLSLYFTIRKNYAGGASVVPHETVRFIVFQYSGENPTELADVQPSDVLETLNPLSFLNSEITGRAYDNTRRIKIIKSKLFTLDNYNSLSRTYKFNMEMNGMKVEPKQHTQFRSSETAQPASGGYFILVISDNGDATAQSEWIINSKFSFYDN